MKLDMILAVILAIAGAVWMALGEYQMAVACLAMAYACRLGYELEKTKELIFKLHTKKDNKSQEVK